jgi:hypothetical protein
MDGIFDLGWTVVQRKSIMYSEMLNERQPVEGKTQWRIGWTLRP